MATKIILKKSSTSGSSPLTSDLDQAELGINLADRKIYTKDNSGSIVTLNGAYVDSVAPANPAEGDLWYDTANNVLKAHNGSAFVSAGYSTLDELENVTITSNTSGEILKWNGSAWVNNTLAEAGIQPAGSYLTAESDTLSSVTGRGATTATAISITNATVSSSTGTGALTVTGGVGVGGNLNVGGNTIVTGNLTVNGTTTSVNSNEVNIGDSIILLNADETGAPSQNSGIEIERGTSANVFFVWNEADDAWDLNNETLQNVVIDGGSY